MDDLSDLSLRQKKFVTLSIMFVAIFFMFAGWYCGSMAAHDSDNYFDDDEKYEFRTFWVEYGYSEGYADGSVGNDYNASRLSTPLGGIDVNE